MKKILNLLTINCVFLGLWGQLQNAGFETNNMGTDCRTGAGSAQGKPFNTANVSNWQASHGSPQLNNKNGISCSSAELDVHSGNYAAILFYDAANWEGIFQDHSFKKGEILNFSIFVKSINANSNVIIKLCSGLNNESTGVAYPISTTPSTTKSQTILTQSTDGNWTNYKVGPIEVNDDYDQIWIYPQGGGGIILDDLQIGGNCCQLYKVYQNISNPPSTYVNDYILAGTNVTSAVPTGDVLITNTDIWKPTVFQAKNSITLAPGFKLVPGANFVARILPCNETELSVEIRKISAIDQPCEFEFISDVCFGSGFYSYLWNINGMELAEGSNLANNRIKFKPKSNKTISVLVTDQISGLTKIGSFTLDWVPFNDPISEDEITLTNVLSPNGDGVNEDWYSSDITRPGTYVYAHNSYKVGFATFFRLGGSKVAEYNQVKEDKVYGVWDKFVFRSGSNMCDIINDYGYTTGWFFYEVEFKNCITSEYYEGAIYVDCNPATSQPYDSIQNIDGNFGNITIDSIKIKPNPFESELKIFSTAKLDYSLLNITGQSIRIGKLNLGMNYLQDLDCLASGVYFLKVNSLTYKLLKK